MFFPTFISYYNSFLDDLKFSVCLNDEEKFIFNVTEAKNKQQDDTDVNN